MATAQKQKLIQDLLDATELEFSDEELIHQLLENKISTNLNESESDLSFGERASDAVAKFTGSWFFIFSFLGIILVWVVTNLLLATKAFDPYPFILLNLFLSCVAAIQAPLIMMSQNRQEAKDRARAESDYRVNLKNELVIGDLHTKLDAVLENQEMLLRLVQPSADTEGSDFVQTESVWEQED